MIFRFSLELLSVALGFMLSQIRFLEDRLDLRKGRLTGSKASTFSSACGVWRRHLYPPPLTWARPDIRFGRVLNSFISFYPYLCKNTEFQYIHKVLLVYLNPGYSNDGLHLLVIAYLLSCCIIGFFDGQKTDISRTGDKGQGVRGRSR